MRLIFPPTTVDATVRQAVTTLRRAGYLAFQYAAPEASPASLAVHVFSSVVYPICADAEPAEQADRILWRHGFTVVSPQDGAAVPACRTPAAVSWRRGWVYVDVRAPRTCGREPREVLAHAHEAAFRGEGWQVERFGMDRILVAPPADATGRESATPPA